MIFILLFTLLGVVVADSAASIALSAILGVIGTFVTQLIKRVAGTSGNKALILTIVVSGVLGFISAWSVGSWDSNDIIASSSIVFTLATLAYKTLLSSDAIIKVNT